MDKLELLKSAMAGAMDKASDAMDAVGDRAKGAMGRAKEMVGLVSEEPAIPPEPSMVEEWNQACALTYRQRVIGFATCVSLGLFCMLLSMLVFFHPVKFAITYSFGNILSLGSTGFLIGFGRQLKSMFDPVRAVAAAVFLVAIVLTLVGALWVQDALLTLGCILIQGSALLWYSLSYIPFAQAAAKRCLQSCLTSEV